VKFSAVILAGGKSSRMGRDKAWLEIEGRSLLARQIQLVRDAGADEVFISGRANADYSNFDCRVLHDRIVDAGPLGGIESALVASSSSLLLVLAVDMPKMQVQLLSRLASQCGERVGVVPRVNGKIEPLAAFYPKAAVGLIEEWFSASRRKELGSEMSPAKSPSATRFAERCVECGLAQLVDIAESETQFFANWNSPEQVERRGLA
jgi:molybdopterin-guanine dinucleotide biosynthesis protein A